MVRRNWSFPELRRPVRRSPGMLPERETVLHHASLLELETARRESQWAVRGPRLRKVEDSSSLLRASKRMGVYGLCVFSGYQAELTYRPERAYGGLWGR